MAEPPIGAPPYAGYSAGSHGLSANWAELDAADRLLSDLDSRFNRTYDKCTLANESADAASEGDSSMTQLPLASQSRRLLNRSEAMSSPTNVKPSSQRVSSATSDRPASRSIMARIARMKWVAGSTSAMYWAGTGMPS